MRFYAILIDFAHRSWHKLPLKWRRVLIGPLEFVFFSEIKLRDLVSFVTYAKLADGGVWHKVYASQPTAYKPPIFHGSLRSKVGERNVLSELPEAGVLELKRPCLVPLNLFHRRDYSGRRVRFLPRSVVTAEGYMLNLNCHNSPSPPPKNFAHTTRRQREPLPSDAKIKTLRGAALGSKYARARCLLLSTADVNYGHTLMDVVPRLALFEKAGFGYDDVDYVIGPRLTPSKRLLMRACGVPLEKYVAASRLGRQSGFAAIGRALIPSFPGAERNSTPWGVDFTRSKLLKSAAPKPTRRVYLHRPSHLARGVSNEDEIEAILRRYDFEILKDPRDEAEARARIDRIAEAALAIGVHGGSLSDIMFCQPGAKVMELAPTDHVQPYFYTLANAGGLEYHCLVCESEGHRGEDALGTTPYRLKVNAAEFEEAIKALI